MCGIGVTSTISVTSIPELWIALIADSRPPPGPFTNTRTLRKPKSCASLDASSPATCAAIGKMGIPEMRERGYPKEISAGTIAAGGTLGILIPPSITMIVYGISTETSIGQLFMAGIFPGLMLLDYL